MNRIFRLFTLAALVVTMAACSSDDNIDETPADIPSQVKGTPFSATISIDDGTTTRTVLTEGMDDVTSKPILNVAWKGDGSEQVALIYNGVRDVLTISEVSGGKATISGSLTGAFNTGDAVRIVYPASYATAATGGTNYTADASAFTAQDGTLATIGTSLDVREGTGKLTKNTTPASLSSDVTMDSKIAVWKLTLKDYEQAISPETVHSVYAKTLTIKNGSDVLAQTSTFSSGKNELYMAVPAVSGATLRIEAFNGTDTYILEKSGVSLAASTYYQSAVKMARPLSGAKVPTLILSQDPRDVGKVIGADGRLYKTTTAASYAGTSGVAMIAKLSGVGHGLAIELNGSPGSANWTTACSNAPGKAAVPGVSGDGKGWRLPSKDDWKAMFVGCLYAATGNAPTSVGDTDINISNFRSMYEATGTTLQSDLYWSSTENEYTPVRAWGVDLGTSTATFPNLIKGDVYRILACLAF